MDDPKMFSRNDPKKKLSRDDPADQWREEGTLLPLWKLALPIENNDADEDNQILVTETFLSSIMSF